MSWAKLDDGTYTHRKFLGLDPAAIGLWAMGLSYCADQLSDGRIPRAQVPRTVSVTPERAYRLAELLVARGLWDKDGDDYIVHDYLVYNPSRTKVLRKRDETKGRVQRFRSNAVGNAVTESDGNAVTDGVGNASPVPSRPVTTRGVEKDGGSSAPDTTTTAPPSDGEQQRLDLYRAGRKQRLGVETHLGPKEIEVYLADTRDIRLDRLAAILRAFFGSSKPFIRESDYSVHVLRRVLPELVKKAAPAAKPEDMRYRSLIELWNANRGDLASAWAGDESDARRAMAVEPDLDRWARAIKAMAMQSTKHFLAMQGFGWLVKVDGGHLPNLERVEKEAGDS